MTLARSRVVGAAFLAACASTPHDERVPRVTTSTSEIETPALESIAPPAILPARYLRTLEHDPGGYGVPGASNTSLSAGKASDLLLGDLLFHSPRTLGAKARKMNMSCDTCHPNGATHISFRIDGLTDRPGNVDLSSAFFRPASDNGAFDPVNIPSLRGCRYTAPYGHDGRTASLAEFVENVVTIEFDGAPLSPIKRASLVRYVLDLDFLPNANIDAHGELTDRASGAAHRGVVEFRAGRAGFGGQSCASCHPASSFYRDGMVHRIGTGDPASPHAIEDGFETPTLLGLAESAPYFHDGRFATVSDVVAWFDSAFALTLSANARSDLTAYVEAVGAVDRPFDDRPLARRLDQSFAYLSLLTVEQTDRSVWSAAIELVLRACVGAPPAMKSRVADVVARLESMRARIENHALLAPEANEARALRRDLARLAADWAGAVSVSR